MDNLLETAKSILRMTPTVWDQLVQNVPQDLLARVPAPGEWSAVDCIRHMLANERDLFPVRVRMFLAGQDIQDYDPDTDGALDLDQSPVELVTLFARYRFESLSLLDELAPSDLEREALHSELGTVTLGQMLNEWVSHDLSHTIQAERAIMQPFIPASGPWRSTFIDHDIAAAQDADNRA